MLFVLCFASSGEGFTLRVDILPCCPSPPFKGSLLHSLSYHISHQNGSFTQLPELPKPTWPPYVCACVCVCVCLRMQWVFLIMSLCMRIFLSAGTFWSISQPLWLNGLCVWVCVYGNMGLSPHTQMHVYMLGSQYANVRACMCGI